MKKEEQNKISKYVKEREYLKALKLLNNFAKKERRLDELNFVFDSYFKLGEYKKGYRLGVKLLQTKRKREYQDFINIWISRFINGLGSSQHAMILIQNIEAKTKEEQYANGGIYLSNFEYHKAIRCYSNSILPLKDKDKLNHPMRALSLADSYSGIGENVKSFELARSLLLFDHAPLNRFIINTACAEYLCKLSRFKESFKFLQRAEVDIPEMEKRVDYAIYLKWKGVCLLGLDQRSEGIDYLRRAIKQLQSFSIREESWLEIIPILFDVNDIDLQVLLKAYHFPGLTLKMKEIWKNKYPTLDKQAYEIKPKNPKFSIDFDSNEYFFEKKWHISIKKEIQLLGIVALAGKEGLSFFKAFSCLWPEEVYSFLSFESRLFQIIKRVKQMYSVEIYCKDNKVFLNDSRISVKVGGDSRPKYLRTNSKFTGRDIQAWYHVSQSQKQKYIKKWLSAGIIEKHGKGPNTYYTVK